MSRTLTPLTGNRRERETKVAVTKFFGGTDRGTCLQLTQVCKDGAPDDVGRFMYIQLTAEQLVQLSEHTTDMTKDQQLEREVDSRAKIAMLEASVKDLEAVIGERDEYISELASDLDAERNQ